MRKLLAVAFAVRSDEAPYVGEIEAPRWGWRKRRVRVAAREAAQQFAALGYVPGGARATDKEIVVELLRFGGVRTETRTRGRTIERRLGLRRGQVFRWDPDRWRAISSEFFLDPSPPIPRIGEEVVLDVGTRREQAFFDFAPEIELGDRVTAHLSLRDRNLFGLGLVLEAVAGEKTYARLTDVGRWALEADKNKRIVASVGAPTPHRHAFGWGVATRAATLTVDSRAAEVLVTRGDRRAYASARLATHKLAAVAAVRLGPLDILAFAGRGRDLRNPRRRRRRGRREEEAVVFGGSLETRVGPHALAFVDLDPQVSLGAVVHASIFALEVQVSPAPTLTFRLQAITPALPQPP